MKLRFSAKDQQILQATYSFAKERRAKLYLVGGALRDIFLGRKQKNPDFDFCLKNGAIAFGRRLAGNLRAGFVVLDKERGACRLIRKTKNKIYTLDFTDFRGRDLKEDLARRDFTINAMALELSGAISGVNSDEAFIDIYKGREDLQAGRIRAVSKKSFSEDPLRILRAFSFSCILGFSIDKETLRLAKKELSGLAKVSYERIREELFKIFASSAAFDCLMMMDRAGALKVIFPEFEKMRGIGKGAYHHLDVWQHTLESVKQLEGLFEEVKNNKDAQAYFKEIIASDHPRRSLVKLGMLLHDVGKPPALRRQDGKTIFHGHERIGLGMTEVIARRLKLSHGEISSLRRMVLWHLRPGYLADNRRLSERAIFRYFRDTGEEAVSVLLLSIADQRATRGPLTTEKSRIHHEKVCFGLIKEYFQKKKEKKAKRLINGNILIRKFKLKPSPLIGEILAKIEEEQAIGRVRDKAGALQAAEAVIKKSKAHRAPG